MKKKHILLTLFTIALALLICVPAVADEGDGFGSSFADVEPSGDGEGDPTSPPEDPTPPPRVAPPPPPTDEPTPPPTDEPTPPPTDEPTSTPPPTDEPTPPPTDEPTPGPDDETPTPEPTDEPSGSEPEGGNAGGYQEPSDPSPTSRPPGGGTGGTIRQPLFPRTQVTPRPSGSPDQEEPADTGPRYITFAKLTQKNNSMSVVLFYSGSACVGTGVLGLLVLTVFIIRGRRSDEREEIFQEIQQAETRRPVRPRPQAVYGNAGESPQEYEGEDYGRYAEGYESGLQPSLHRPEPEELAVPVNGSLYTEEFQLPQAMPVQQAGAGASPEPVAPVPASMYTEEFQPLPVAPAPRGEAQPSAVSGRVSLYTEEFSLPEEMAQPPVVSRPARNTPPPQNFQQGAYRAAAPQRRPASPPAKQPENFDTQELLREILHGDGKN